MTFRQFCRDQGATYDEADALAWHLAQMRARALYVSLRPQPRYSRGAKV